MQPAFAEVRGSILLVDHDLGVLAQLAEVLAEAGYHCPAACDAETALRLIVDMVPDLIIAEAQFGELAGTVLCDELKQRVGLPHVPSMYLSSVQGPDVIRRGHGNGAAYHVRKPFDAAVLLSLVEQVLHLPAASSR